jgi:competence protein ComEA
VKFFRRAPAPDPGARERALARLGARPPEHVPDEHPEESDDEVRGGWIPDSIRPERLRTARWTLSPRHVLVLAAVLAVGLTWAACSALRAHPETIPNPSTTPGTPINQPGTSPPSGAQQSSPAGNQPGTVQPGAGATQPAGAQNSPSTPGQSPALVVVHVAGKVRRPGLVRAPVGSRVADVLALAGGALPGVDLTTLNLARQVTDGEQIIVGQPTQLPPPTVPGSTSSSGSTPATTTSVNLNTATLDQLDTLPGVGPVLAQRILDYRTQNGPFTTIDQLEEVPGVGPKKFDSLKPHVRV